MYLGKKLSLLLMFVSERKRQDSTSRKEFHVYYIYMHMFVSERERERERKRERQREKENREKGYPLTIESAPGSQDGAFRRELQVCYTCLSQFLLHCVSLSIHNVHTKTQ